MNEFEEKNIRMALDQFIEGLRTLDYTKISNRFYEHGLSIGVSNDEISHVLRDHWKEMKNQKEGTGENYIDDEAQDKIEFLKIIGNAATVIVELAFINNNKTTEKYTDFFHMLKVQEKWIIVNKIYPT